MTNKQPLLLPSIIPYMEYLDYISDDEITFILSLLDINEKKRIKEYHNWSKTNISKKRLFLYICNLIDFKEVDNRYKNNN